VVILVQKRSEKEQVISELHDKFAKAKVAIIAEPKRIDVATVTELRKKFRAQKVEYKVVKNTLAIRAAKGTGAEVLGDLFAGPTALIMGYEDPVSPAKVLQEFLEKKKDLMRVRGAVVDGRKLDAKGAAGQPPQPAGHRPGARSRSAARGGGQEGLANEQARASIERQRARRILREGGTRSGG
jgi:large subunit ribosomal protein L10